MAGDTLTGVTTDPSGSVGVSGITLGNFPGYSSPPLAKDVVAKLDSGGNVLWINQFGTNSGDFLNAIAGDRSGNFYVGGLTQGAFPGYSNPSASFQGVVAKLDGAGNKIWLDEFLLNNNDTYVTSVGADPIGNLIVLGYSSPPGVSAYDLFVENLNASTGKRQWIRQFSPDFANSLAVDSAGDVYFTGVSNGTFPGAGTSAPEPFVVKLSGKDGSQQWVQQFQSQYPGAAVELFGVATDRQGNVVVGGTVSSKQIIGIPYPDVSDQCVLAKLDSGTGNIIWIKTFGTGAGDEINQVSVDPQGNVTATGITEGLFAPGYQQPANDIFVLKFDPEGNNIWAQQIGNGPLQNITGPELVGAAITTDSLGNIFIGAPTQGAFPGFSNPNNAVEMFVAKYGP